MHLTVLYSNICFANSHKHVLASEKVLYNDRGAKIFLHNNLPYHTAPQIRRYQQKPINGAYQVLAPITHVGLSTSTES